MLMQGGELVVEHAGKVKAFDFGNSKGYSVCCAAFYAGNMHHFALHIIIVVSLCAALFICSTYPYSQQALNTRTLDHKQHFCEN